MSILRAVAVVIFVVALSVLAVALAIEGAFHPVVEEDQS